MQYAEREGYERLKRPDRTKTIKVVMKLCVTRVGWENYVGLYK